MKTADCRVSTTRQQKVIN